MTRLWSFLQKRSNREVLAWLGGGAVVLAGALWTLFVYFDGGQGSPSGGSVSAESGGVAVGGNVEGSSITIQGTVPDSGTTQEEGDATSAQ